MRLVRTIGVVLSAVVLLTAPTSAGPIVEAFPHANGEVNWSEGALRASGSGTRPRDVESTAQARLLARRAAIADAYRNLAHLVDDVHVTSTTTIERYVVSDDTVRINVEAYIRDAHIVQEQEFSDGSYVVTLQIGLTGKEGLTGLILPGILQGPATMAEIGLPKPAPPATAMPPLEQIAGTVPGPATLPVSLPAPDSSPVTPPTPVAPPTPLVTNLEPELLTPADARGPFTGLIIDARGLNVQPAMSPRIYDADGKEVYGTVHIDIDQVEEVGVCGYMGTIKTGLGVSRVGKQPLVIRAAGTPDEFHRYVTISNDDARRVLEANAASHFLEKGAVVIVIDERRARDENQVK